MKKLFPIAGLLAVVLMFSLTGCQKNNENEANIPGYNENKDENKPSGKDDPSVTPEEQIEKTAKALMEALDVPNWKADAEFVHNVVTALQSKHYDFEALESWADDLAKAWDKGAKKEGSVTIYSTMVRLSDAKGHFEEQADGTFSYTKASDFQITVNIDGEKVSATFSCTDSTVPVKLPVTKESARGYDPATGYSQGYEVSETYLYVPTEATLKILRAGKEFASMDLNTKVDMKNPNEPDPFTDSASLNATVKVGVYTIGIQKLEYSPTGAGIKVKILNGNNSLVSASADATYTLNESNKDIPVKTGSGNAELDIMGMIQLKGNLPDFPAFQAALENVSEEGRSGGYQLSTAVSNLEKTFTVGMYFNGASTARANLGLEAMKNGSAGHWSVVPVLRFADGKSFGFEEYFSEERFGGLIDYAENWSENIRRTIDGLFGEIVR